MSLFNKGSEGLFSKRPESQSVFEYRLMLGMTLIIPVVIALLGCNLLLSR